MKKIYINQLSLLFLNLIYNLKEIASYFLNYIEICISHILYNCNQVVNSF